MKKITTIVFLFASIFVLVCTLLVWKNSKKFKKEKRIEEFSPEFQPLLSEVKGVMEGKIVIEDAQNPLSHYNLDKAIYNDVTEASVEIKMNNVICKNNVWYIKVEYGMSYEDGNGNLLMAGGGEPTWKVGKRNGKWVLLEVCGHGDIAYDEEWVKFWSKYGG